jgi:hypothetical protein
MMNEVQKPSNSEYFSMCKILPPVRLKRNAVPNADIKPPHKYMTHMGWNFEEHRISTEFYLLGYNTK